MHLSQIAGVLVVLLACLGLPSEGRARERTQDELPRVEIQKVTLDPPSPKVGDGVTVRASLRNPGERLLLVNVRLLMPEQLESSDPSVEQILFVEAQSAREVLWRAKVVAEGKWSVRVSQETISVGRPPGSDARAKIPAAAKEALGNTWSGTWTSPEGYVYDAELKLQLGASGSLEGSIRWTLQKAPETRPDYAGKIGAKGVEYVWGTYKPQARAVEMEGYRRDDPKQILGLDRYKLTFSEGYDEIKGATWNHGTWQATFTLKPAAK